MINKFPKREEGQGLVEYALILVLVAVVVIAVLLVLGPELRLTFAKITAYLSKAGVITSSGAITSVDASYIEGGFGSNSSLTVTINVSQSTSVTISGDVTFSPATKTCNPGSACTFGPVTNPPSSGSIVATDSSGGEGVVAFW